MHKSMTFSLGAVAAAAFVASLAAPAAAASPTATSWKIAASPSPSSDAQLTSVSCPTKSFCTAVGASSTTASAATTALVETWKGATWSVSQVPGPAGATDVHLDGVSCVSTSNCLAVGVFGTKTVSSLPLTEELTGSTWRLQTTPSPAGSASANLSSVSCLTGGDCWSVGSYQAASGDVHTLAERWNGTKWSIVRTPNPAGLSTATLVEVSCASTTFCEAVGSDQGTSFQEPLVEGLHGNSWALQSISNPTGDASSQTTAVSCDSPTFCMAVGITDRNSTGLATPLFWRFRDSRWTTPAKAAVPADAIGTGLVAVECESPAACTAGGGYAKVRNEGLTLAEAWNGKKWIAEATPNPTAATSSDINALSCASADSCTAVGTYFNASYDAQTLVMQR